MYFTYILQSLKSGGYYIGYSGNILERLSAHNRGSTRSTKAGRPWKLVYAVEFTSKEEAMKREKLIKSYKGGDAFKNLIAN